MRQAVYTGPGSLRVEDRPTPPLTPGGVRVRVEACGVCGTDVATLLRGEHAVPGQVLGHESVGTVAELGTEVRELQLGDRVVIRPLGACRQCAYCRRGEVHLCADTAKYSLGFGVAGAFAETVLVPDAAASGQVVRVVRETPIADAVWTEPFAVALHAVARAGALPGERALVVGAGPIGLATVAAARHAGMTVEVIEPRARRRIAALELGAASAAAPEDAPTGPLDVVFDASGVAAALTDPVTRLTAGGRLVLVGLGHEPIPPVPPGVGVFGAFAFTPREFVLAARLIEAGTIRLAAAISHEFELAETARAIETAAHDPGALKVIVRPSG